MNASPSWCRFEYQFPGCDESASQQEECSEEEDTEESSCEVEDQTEDSADESSV